MIRAMVSELAVLIEGTREDWPGVEHVTAHSGRVGLASELTSRWRVDDRRDARRELEDEPDGGALLGRRDRRTRGRGAVPLSRVAPPAFRGRAASLRAGESRRSTHRSRARQRALHPLARCRALPKSVPPSSLSSPTGDCYPRMGSLESPIDRERCPSSAIQVTQIKVHI